jgi:hypothetical protein
MKIHRILTYEGPPEWVERQPFNPNNLVQDTVAFGESGRECRITSTWVNDPETDSLLGDIIRRATGTDKAV